MNHRYEKLRSLLKQLFQLDQPALDFGLYRVMHAKSAEVSQFLDRDLLPQVKDAFSLYKTADKASLEKELSEVIAGIQVAGMNPDDSPKVVDLRARLETDAADIEALESEVYDHLFSFFRRYYSEGDFLAQRVYRPGVYAIPYEGEEVTLHWANKDQYYIKSNEYLRDYAFRLRPDNDKSPLRVHFRLTDATQDEHGNVKATDGNDRLFILAGAGESGHDFLAQEPSELGNDLVICFEHRPPTLADWSEEQRALRKKPPAQKDLSALAVKYILAVTDAPWAGWVAELAKPHTTPSGELSECSHLEVHLKRYVARNTFDYFIHKDLGTFLRRELDFFIKNEVMHLDDLENQSGARIVQHLSKIKVIREIAGKIIHFLAQLEDFQKKLWLKRKFVVETQYCIAVGSIPEAFYPEIAASEAQRKEWVELLAIDGIKGDLTTFGYCKQLKPEFLKAHPTLMVDTRHFDVGFTARLLAALDDLDTLVDGLLFHSENFQALQLLELRYRGQIRSVYIDPPYNTASSSILYKNDFKDSSWLSLMHDRLFLAKVFLSNDGILCCAIDDEEVWRLRALLRMVFPKEIGVAPVRSTPIGRTSRGKLSPTHEYALFYGGENASPGPLIKTDKQKERYPLSDERGRYAWRNLLRTGTNDRRADRPKLYYPIYVSGAGTLRVPRMEWNEQDSEYEISEQPRGDEVVVWPIKEQDGVTIEKNWERGWDRVQREAHEYRVQRGQDGGAQGISIHFVQRMDESSAPKTWWGDSKYASSNHGAKVLKNLFVENPFDFPKSVPLVEDCIRASGGGEGDAHVLDFFAGSGSTGHAVINLNREDGAKRKFVLVEMGDYFDTVLLPRIKKITFTPEWKDGKPHRLASPEEADRSPRIVKVIRLESYEDALNNLETRRTQEQQRLLDDANAKGPDRLREQYMLRYMLDVETRGSQSLLNVQAFNDPRAYKLRIKRPGSDESSVVAVDLFETFNWLIGLTIHHISEPQTLTAVFKRDSEARLRLKGRLKQARSGPYWFQTVTGRTPDDRRTLVIWRRLTGTPEQDNLVLDEWFTSQGYSDMESQFDLIYVNGSNNLESLKSAEDVWRVRLIEEDFHRLLFQMEAT